MASNSYSVRQGQTDSSTKFSNVDNLLILEKSLEHAGQEWIENLNIIEQLLVRVTDRLGKDNPKLKSKFIIRRLPTYIGPFVNKNEYGILLEDVKFTTTSQSNAKLRADRPGTANFGQIEIFYPGQASSGNSCGQLADEENDSDENSRGLVGDANILNEHQAYCSHEIFKRFTAAFVDTFQSECEVACSESAKEPFSYSGEVQLVGPHLLLELLESPEVQKIFTLMQPPLPLPKNLKAKCTVNVNYLKSMITITYDDTEVVVRPCLFNKKGFTRVNANILERLPLHHSAYLQIGESLNKGFILFPTSFETLWTLQFWPSESHIISIYHPSSLTSRVLKLFAAFCLNPLHFWEIVNNSFLVGIVDDSSMQSFWDDSKGNLLNADFLFSSFAYELEDFCNIEDWAPRNFSTRLMHLLRTSVDCFDKGFHTHYFTKINVLRGIWKNSDHFEKEEKSVLRALDDITESQEDLDDYGEKAIMEIDDLEDDFGFQFEDLETIDDEHINPRQTSETIYRTLNPYQSRDNLALSSQQALSIEQSSQPTTLSRMFGSNLVRRLGLGNKLSRRHSDASLSKNCPPKRDSVNSMTDIASGFEESIAHMRRPDSLRLRFKYEPEDLTETSFSNKKSKRESTNPTSSQCEASTSFSAYQNEGFQSHIESIYSLLLQNLNDLPPSDYLSDQEMLADLDRSRKTLESQEELVSAWGKACSELPKPKYICPHVFSKRQIQYLSLIIQTVSKCSPNMIQIIKASKMLAWEISGDILRTVLHQMRMEVADIDTIREKQRPNVRKHSRSFKEDLDDRDKDKDGKQKTKKMSLSMKFSLRKKSNTFACTHDFGKGESVGSLGRSGFVEPERDVELALEEPEIAATNKLLEWLWQLRCSEIGRLSDKAYKYIEQLFKVSLINSHFLEQISEDKTFKTMALKSAVAVTRIMADESFPVNVPLCAATNKGWLWAEMILSLASWNNEKGFVMKAVIPVDNSDGGAEGSHITRILGADKIREKFGIKYPSLYQENIDPDIDAATLAFHSEIATPIGWNDFEDPRRPGPLAASILIFSSIPYYKLWEMIPGNIVQSLQHVGTGLTLPHRKTALNEIRKLNKSLSFRIYNFDDNVMSKTFRRLASLRNTRNRLLRRTNAESRNHNKFYSCRDVGCRSHSKNTVTTLFNGTEFECTKL